MLVYKNDLIRETLPFITHYLQGESLHGYLLRLDYINRFPSGTVINMIKTHTTGTPSLNRLGLFLIGTIFNLEKLSGLVNLDIEEINELILAPSLRRVFRTENVNTYLAGYSRHFKLCPLCIEECYIPLVHSFVNIDTCINHGVILQDKCACGNRLILFNEEGIAYHCPFCNKPFKYLPIEINVNLEDLKKQLYLHDAYIQLLYKKGHFIPEDEDLKTGFERRFQYLSYELGIEKGKFKKLFGYDASNMKNGHGPVNISLSRILEILFEIGYSVDDFYNLDVSDEYFKLEKPLSNTLYKEHVCPNIYCNDYQKEGLGNIKYYGKKKYSNYSVLVEEYCITCGTRFFGRNIIQSYDYNPGVRKHDIEKARKRIVIWQESLTKVCEEMILNMIPITLTGCFKKAGIPIGRTYFVKRLGLIDILESFAQKQKRYIYEHICDFEMNDYKNFLNRIYHKRKQ
jgi:hypothetical protein